MEILCLYIYIWVLGDNFGLSNILIEDFYTLMERTIDVIKCLNLENEGDKASLW